MSILNALAGGLGVSGLNIGKLISGNGITTQIMKQLGEDELARAKPTIDYNYKLGRESRQTYYGDAKQSLLDAGYNPLLAVGGGSSAGAISSTGSTQDSISPVISAAMQIRQLGMAKKKNDAEVNLLNQQANAIQGTGQGMLGAIVNGLINKFGGADKIIDWITNQATSSAQDGKEKTNAITLLKGSIEKVMHKGKDGKLLEGNPNDELDFESVKSLNELIERERRKRNK